MSSRERMLVLMELREERKSKALPSEGEDLALTLLQLEYWVRAMAMRSLATVNPLIVIICNTNTVKVLPPTV